MKMSPRWQVGVTLFELMVAVAIIAVLAGIAIPLYTGYIQSGYKTECKNEVSAIKLAEEEYYLKNNAYFPNPVGTVTTALTDSVGSNPIEIASGGTAGSSNIGGTYVSSYDTAQKIANANCTYSVTSQNSTPYYTITATGANKLAGTGTVLQVTK